MNKERYEYYKSHGICVNCCSEKAVEGYVLCQNCRIRASKKLKKYRAKHRESILAKKKEHYYKSKELRICYYCGKPTTKGTLCDTCREKDRMCQKRRRIGLTKEKEFLYEQSLKENTNNSISLKELKEQRIKEGICTKCGKNYALPFRKLCYECSLKKREYASKYFNSMTDEEKKEHKKNLLELSRKRYHRLKASGICTKCGQKPIDFSRSVCLCMECAIKAMRARRERSLKEKFSRVKKERAKGIRYNKYQSEINFCTYYKGSIPKLSFDLNFRANFYNSYITDLKLMDISFEDFNKDPVNLGKEIRMKYAEMRGLNMDYIKERLCLK